MSPGTENPLLKRLVQLYLAGGQTVEQLVIDADLDPRDRKRVQFFLENLIQATAPSNVPLVNPASAKAVIDTAGLSLVRGGKQLVKDLASAPRIPEMVDGSGFVLGENIAATPGGVVFRNEVLELIQYAPQTDEVYEVPALVVPPTINKFYALDLAPERSLVEHGVRQGRQMFVISWRNPDSRHASWNLDTYVRAVLDALDAVEEITGSARTVLGGVCSGGILASMAAAYLAGIGRQDRLAALCLAVTVIDNHDAGTASALVDERMAGRAKAKSARKGYLDGRALAEVFAWLRPGDLVWNYWVNNYLLGKRPPAFDILFWNSDTTRMTAALHADFVDLAMENSLTRPGALTVLGVPIDLGKITVDSYVVAGITDHITPWENCYRSAQLFGGTTRFVLSTSGHIAALVNPPGNPKASFHTDDDLTSDAKVWLKGSDVHQGTWWTDLGLWLDERCGDAASGARGARLAPPERARGGARHLRLRQVTRFLRVRVLGHDVRVAVRPGTAPGPPLVLCNGIGASLDLLQPFVDEVDPRIEVVRFDVPGVGGSPTPKVPYNFALLACFVGRLLDELGYDRFDALGISWGGGLAQQLAFQYPRRCRRLVLVSTGTGMSDGARPASACSARCSPRRRYRDPAYAKAIAPMLYGGRMRRRPDEVEARAVRTGAPRAQGRLLPPAPRRRRLDEPPRPAAHPAAHLDPRRERRPDHPAGQRADHAARCCPTPSLHVYDDGHLGLLTSADELGPLVSRFLTSPSGEKAPTCS